MKRKIYVETSVISYLTARPSKTIIGAAHQQLKEPGSGQAQFNHNQPQFQEQWERIGHV